MYGLGVILTILGVVLAFITYSQDHPAVSIASGFITAIAWCIIALYYGQKYRLAKTALLAIEEEARINDILLETDIHDI